jgi:hypothetical protein
MPEEGQPSAFRDLINQFPDEALKEIEAEKAIDAQLDAERLKRSKAAKLGWWRR